VRQTDARNCCLKHVGKVKNGGIKSVSTPLETREERNGRKFNHHDKNGPSKICVCTKKSRPVIENGKVKTKELAWLRGLEETKGGS